MDAYLVIINLSSEDQTLGKSRSARSHKATLPRPNGKARYNHLLQLPVHREPMLFTEPLTFFFAEGTERMDRERRNGAVANRFPEIKRESKSVRQTFAELLTGQHRKCFSLRQDHGKHVKFAQARRGC